jgi:hypothetical protein
MLAFSVVNSDLFASSLRLVADLSNPVNVSTVQASDLIIDGSIPATSVNVLDADTVEFLLPALTSGTHSAAIAAGSMSDSTAVPLSAFSRSFVIAIAPQLTVKHNPRLQPGNAPLAGYAGGSLDRVDLLWQTIPGGAGTQDTFAVAYRAVGATSWQAAALNATISTGVEGRIVHSSSITGLDWNTNYEYRVRQLRGDVIVAEYQATFRTRLQSGVSSPFTFVAYGDSASGSATGFRQVQARINQVSPSFAVLLGDNVYDAGSHTEFDARLDPAVNPEAAAWMATHIDYLGVGNHDIGTGSGLPSEQNYSVPIPVAGVTAPAAPPASERSEHSYSWDYGNVHFVTFDTNSYTDATRLDGLLNWVLADLNASTARWKIVYGHHPLAGVPDKPESASDNYYQQVVNRLKAAGVDLYMTGHSHTYSWTYPLTGQINGVATYVNHGFDDRFTTGEGLTQLVSGLGGKEIRDGNYDLPFIAEGFTNTTATPGRLGFSQVAVTPTQLTVSYVAADNGTVIDSFTISKDDTVQTASFQQGASGYAGTVDTFLHQNAPTTNNAAATSLKVDNDDPAGTGNDAQALLRFDNLFGSGAGQIPLNATIRSATLQLQVTNGSVDNMNLHRMLSPWTAADTWNSRIGGVQTDGVEALTAPDTSSGQSQVGAISFNVLSSLQTWLSNPNSNLGWAIVPTGADGVDFHSSEGTIKPKLIVTYVVPTGPNTPPIAAGDVATTNGGTSVTVAVLNNDVDANGDFLTVQAATPPVHGTTLVNSGGTVTYTPAAGFFGTDRFAYTIGDGRGGTATATVTITVLQSTSFQQGTGGYGGSVDTILQQSAPTANNAAVTPLNVDGDDPSGSGQAVQTLLRFDNLFGTGAGQIPSGATLQSATLQLQVTNAGASMNLHRMLVPWAATDTWNSLTGGVQANGVEAVAAADLASGALAVGQRSLDVLASLQAWQGAPTSNRGWAMLPTGTDGVDFDSSEGTTRPKLVVNYLPPAASSFQVTAISPTTTGVILDFNRDLDPTTLNLYDREGSPLGPADVTLVGAISGATRGSVVIDPNLRRLTFIRTNGLLPADTYTLTLRSAADGFRDSTGALLDGDGNGTAGDSYSQTFTVSALAANTVTVSVPNFARGPQQPVNLPAGGTSGIPLSFSDGNGITTATLQINYDPALLTIAGATVAVGLPAGSTVSLNTSTPGIAALQFSSPTALAAGTTRFADLQASVPASAGYRSKQVLDISNIVLNSGALPARDDDALHVVAYFGDASGNGAYSAQDASLISRLAVGLDGGLQLYRLLDPVVIADITGNGAVSAADTSLILQVAVGISTPEVPLLPFPAFTVTAGGPDPKLSIPTDLVARAGERLQIPIRIESVVDLTGSGLASADLVVEYDAAALEITSVVLGNLLTSTAGGWTIAARIDPMAGRVVIAVAGTKPLEGFFQGDLVQLQATVKRNAAPGLSRLNLAAAAPGLRHVTQLNEGYLTLNPAPTNSSQDRGVDGLLRILPANRLPMPIGLFGLQSAASRANRDQGLLQLLAEIDRLRIAHSTGPATRFRRR